MAVWFDRMFFRVKRQGPQAALPFFWTNILGASVIAGVRYIRMAPPAYRGTVIEKFSP